MARGTSEEICWAIARKRSVGKGNQDYFRLVPEEVDYEAVSANGSVSGLHEDKNPFAQYIILD